MSLKSLLLQLAALLPLLLILYAWGLRVERRLLTGLTASPPRRWGRLWPLVDVLRALTKPERLPAGLGRWIMLASAPLALGLTLGLWALVPLGPLQMGGRTLVPPNLSGRSLFLVMLLDGLGVIAVLLYGRASRQPYVWTEAQRVARQALGYSLPAWIAICGAVMLAGTTDLAGIAQAQSIAFPFFFYQPLGLLLVTLAFLSGHRRQPCRLPGPATMLSGDYQLQHAGSTWALFHLSEYWHLLFYAALIATLYLGGWQSYLLPSPLGLALKTLIVMALFLWLRGRPLACLRRRLGVNLWRTLMLSSLLNMLVTACALLWSR